MSNHDYKKFKKTDFSYDEEEDQFDSRKNKVDKYKAKRVERALKTKDISALIEDEDEWDDYIPFEGSSR